MGVYTRYAKVLDAEGKALTVRYYTLLDPDQSIESLSEQLMSGGRAGVKSVSWELPRKSE
jgi:hypothetical protein